MKIKSMLSIKHMLLCTTLLTYGATIWSSDFQPPYDSRFIASLGEQNTYNFQSTAPLGLPGSDISAVAAPFDPSESYTSQSIAPLGSPKPNNSKVSVLVQTEEIIDSTNNLPLKIHEELQSKYDVLQKNHQKSLKDLQTLESKYDALQQEDDALEQELTALQVKYLNLKFSNNRGMNPGDSYEKLLSENNTLKQKLIATQNNADFKMYASFLAGQASAITPTAIQAVLAGCAVAKVGLHLLNKYK